MRFLFFALTFVVGVGISGKAIAGGKPTEKALITAVDRLKDALIHKDTAALNQLLSPNLSYGHSNGWIENKQEMKADLYNGKITYISIIQASPRIQITGIVAIARMTATFEAELEGKRLTFELEVMQVWLWQNNQWQLLARQSTKIK